MVFISIDIIDFVFFSDKMVKLLRAVCGESELY
jgi:hypothetical protein